MKKIRLIIAVAVAALMVMGVGYALWSQTLNVTVNGKIATFDVYFENKIAKTTDPDAQIVFNAEKATEIKINAGGQFYPGRIASYVFTLVNDGSLDAKRVELKIVGDNPVVKTIVHCPEIIKAKSQTQVSITVHVPANLETEATTGGNFSFTITPKFEQNP